MSRKLWGSLGVFAFIAAGAGAAGAADLAVKAPVYKAPPPVILSDWAGFYIGINGGGGWADNKFDVNSAVNQTGSGGLFGGHAGYNWQYGNVVAGVEVDFDGADLNKSAAVTAVNAAGAVVNNTLTTKTDELASARARLGYVVVPNLLAYGTAGLGWGHSKVSVLPTFGTDDVSQFGWVAGAGLEYKLWGPLIARAEYLHYDFGKESLPAVGDNVKTSVDAVRGGLSYKF
jgi:opacity protein-like surface antigen